MRKIIPLHDVKKAQIYKDSKADAVLMGTHLGSTRQKTTFTPEEMGAVQKIVPVVAVYNRFYFETEIASITEEMEALAHYGIETLMCTDLGIVNLNLKHQFGFKIILDTDTTMTNAQDIAIYLQHGVSEVIVGRELTLQERLDLAGKIRPLGMHFFGYQLMSFSRRKHLTNYSEFRDLDLDLNQHYWLQESKRDDDYLIFEDHYGTHIYAPKVMSAIHAYDAIAEAGYQTILLDDRAMDEDVLLQLCRELDVVENYEQYEASIQRQYHLDLGKGLLYQKTNQGGSQNA